VRARRARGPRASAAPAVQDPLIPPEARAEDLRRGEMPVDVRVSSPAAPQEVRVENAGPAGDEDGLPPERRRGTRAAYSRRVPAFGERAMRVLVARDLSVGGMRVERLGGLSLGDRLHLAI